MPNKPVVSHTMKTPLITSAVIHVIIILLVIFGLPHFKTEPEIIESIPVEMVSDISELTTAVKPPVKAPVPKEIKPEPPKPKPTPPKPTPPKQAAEPDPEELKAPPEKKPEPVKDELAPPKKIEKKEPPKPTPPKPKPVPKKVEKKDDSTEDFNKLLNDLQESEPKTADTPDEPKKDKLMTEPTPSPNVSKFSDALSMSEQDALRQQLAGCWNINAGMMNAQELAVEIRVVVNRDRTVSDVQVVDRVRYGTDSMFRIMADSALRAVRNPRCSPLRLPENKYNLWRNMTIVFDPKDMF